MSRWYGHANPPGIIWQTAGSCLGGDGKSTERRVRRGGFAKKRKASAFLLDHALRLPYPLLLIHGRSANSARLAPPPVRTDLALPACGCGTVRPVVGPRCPRTLPASPRPPSVRSCDPEIPARL